MRLVARQDRKGRRSRADEPKTFEGKNMSTKINRNESVFGKAVANDEIADFMRLLNIARDIFKQELAIVEIMPGGLTNKNYRIVTEDGTQLAIRLAGKGTADYINRPGEKQNASQMAFQGIAPEIYYYDEKTGSQIVEYIDAPTMHPADFQTRTEVMEKAGRVMNKYHNSGATFGSSFDPIAKVKEYVAILEENGYDKRYFDEGWDRMAETLEKIAAAYAKKAAPVAPCHCDTLAENFMLQEDGTMRVIDWEYSGMTDPYYDCACVCVENPLDDECEKVYFGAYCGGEPTEEQKARLLINKFLVTTHWSTWSLVQIVNGKDADFYWEYGRVRAVQACSFLDNPNFDKYLELISE